MMSITLVAAAVTLVVGVTLASSMKGIVSDEILKSGLDGVKLLSSYGRVLVKNAQTQKPSFDSAADFFRTVTSVQEGSDLGEQLLLKIDGNESPIIDAYVTLSEGTAASQEGKIWSMLPTESGDKMVIRSSKEVFFSDQAAFIEVRQGAVTRDGIETPVFIFEADLQLQKVWNIVEESQFRPKRGKARIFLSAARVKEASEAVFFLMAIILVVAVVVSLVIAFILARGITSPVLRLVRDMTVVARGDLDHKTTASSTDEIGYLSSTFNHLTKSLKAAHEAEVEKEKLEHDLSVGREIQLTLLPKTLYKIPGYDLSADYKAAKEVGGDYYDLIPVDKSKLGVVVADVSGKGIQGAMIMTIMRTVMNIAATGNLSTKNCLSRTNRFLSDRIKRGMFVTSFYAILDCRAHKLNFSSAGHNPMVVYRAKTKTLDMLNPTGIAVGFDKGPLFERTLKEAETMLEPGDRFVLYTDGVVESMNEAHEEYTDQRFHDFVMAHAELDSTTFVHKLMADLKKHQGKAPQHDDITIVTFRRN